MSDQAPPSRADTPIDLDQARWSRLAEAGDIYELCRCWMPLQTGMIDGVLAGLVVVEGRETGSFAAAATYPAEAKQGTGLEAVVERVVSERRGVALQSERGVRLGYPVRLDETIVAVAALELAPRDAAQMQQAMRQLQWGVAWLQNWYLRRTSATSTDGATAGATALELASIVVEQERFAAAATAFVTELATRLRCDRVAIGLTRRRKVKLQALSHSAQFEKKMGLIRAIGMAMAEAVDQHDVLVWPPLSDSGPGHVLRLHEQLARSEGSGAICTVPFGDDDERPLGAVTFERSADEPFDDATVELCDAVVALVGPILEAKRRNDFSIPGAVFDRLRIQWRRLVGPRYLVRKLVVGGLLALCVFLAVAHGTYRVKGRTVLEGEVRRVVVAPYRGYIETAPVRAGETVDEGQLMAELDTRDLQLEFSRWSGEREQYLAERRKALADGDAASAGVLRAKMNQAEAQLALLDAQLKRARIEAPFAGLVVSGDLSQALGSPVETGDVLFEIAPLDAYRVELFVDERDIGEVAVGQTGELVLTAMPSRRLAFEVAAITPVSVPEEGANFFVVEAMLLEADPQMRPGMEGFGKIEIDRRRLLWIWTHEIVDWVRLRAWSWLP